MPRLLLVLPALYLFAAASPAPAVLIVEDVIFNNGLEPPNPANVIDASNSFINPNGADVYNIWIQAQGCDVVNLGLTCPAPGDTTAVSMVLGGQILGTLKLKEDSIFVMSGGIILEDLESKDWSSVTIEGGSVLGIFNARSSQPASMSGGNLGGLEVDDTPLFTMTGGTISGDVEVSGSFTMTGGDVEGDVLVDGGSQDMTLIDGGDVEGTVTVLSRLVISSGTLQAGLVAEESGAVTWNGGGVGLRLIAKDSSPIDVFGSDFKVDGTPVSLGPLAASSGRLSGTRAADGGAINLDFCHKGSSDCGAEAAGLIMLVPEPAPVVQASAVLLALAALRSQSRSAATTV